MTFIKFLLNQTLHDRNTPPILYNSRSNSYREFSHFYRTDIQHDGIVFKSAEQMYQYYKCIAAKNNRKAEGFFQMNNI